MTLVEKINEDMKIAMKAQDKETLSVIRMMKSAVQMAKIELKHDLSDEEVVDVISKQIKMRKDSVLEFKNAGRDDLVEQYNREIEVLNKYIRTGLCEDENIKTRIDRLHSMNLFKLQLMPCFKPEM